MHSPVPLPIEKLTVHPLLEPVPRLALEAPEMQALIRSVETLGFLRPVLVNDRHEILDGRCLVLAAEKTGQSTVPTLLCPDEDAPAIILDTLCARRHLTKSAQAYLACPLLESSAAARRQAQIRGLLAGKKARALIPSTHGETVEEIAARFGFKRDLFYQARQAVALFAAQPAYRRQMEPHLLSGEVSLQGVIAGWTGKQIEGRLRRQADQLDLFGEVFNKLRYHCLRTWNSMDAGRRAALGPQIREAVADMPQELRELFARELRAAAKNPAPPRDVRPGAPAWSPIGCATPVPCDLPPEQPAPPTGPAHP
jgi:hypothetical protein